MNIYGGVEPENKQFEIYECNMAVYQYSYLEFLVHRYHHEATSLTHRNRPNRQPYCTYGRKKSNFPQGSLFSCSNKSTRTEISHGFQKWSQKVPYDIRKTYILESHYEST
jgi:hypothetical protein